MREIKKTLVEKGYNTPDRGHSLRPKVAMTVAECFDKIASTPATSPTAQEVRGEALQTDEEYEARF